jgi:hypothetical protein
MRRLLPFADTVWGRRIMQCFLRWFVNFLCALGCLYLGAWPAQAERRVALSVGIDVYDNLPADKQLQKAVNDARAIGAALKKLGFEATVEPEVTFRPSLTGFAFMGEPGARHIQSPVSVRSRRFWPRGVLAAGSPGW